MRKRVERIIETKEEDDGGGGGDGSRAFPGVVYLDK